MGTSFDIEQIKSEFKAQRYFASLDGLRTLSIVPVVWHHATPRPLPGLLGRGPIGVDLFFAISGFLITTLLLRERAHFGRIDLAGFYARRSWRIFPLYYLVLGLHLAYAMFVRPDWAPSLEFLERWSLYATYTANWSSPAGAGPMLFAFAWSLCIEEQFYAFWAPVLRWCQRLRWAALLMGIWLAADLACETLLPLATLEAKPLLRVLTGFATPIGFGALLALAMERSAVGSMLCWLFARRWAAPAVGLAVASLVVRPWAPPVVLHLGLALLVLCCSVRRDHGLARLLDGAPMRYVGRVSYGIYLWHVPVIGVIRTAVPTLREQAALVFALAMTASIGVAACSFHYFEQPLIRRARTNGAPRRLVFGAPRSEEKSDRTELVR